ncbi:universal stress protein [Ktedonobacter racemifer]|uniref:UspA domain protein n=1 Tax=Ktedonobacter racemifer DSM 44963 TaxID=485913 RepID=D6TRM3_KTERA|nr:universal stress protein [Ktedonobacter racemifer]EFH85975.1 UspA domain protein [Ktedonobacter racemifer DSM 44963]
MFHNVLVPLDGSAFAERVLPLAAAIVRRSGGTLFLARVVRVIDNMGSYMALANPYACYMYADDDVDSAEDAKNYLTHLTQTPVVAGIETQQVVLYGEAASSLLAFAREQHVDMFVMSTHGRTGFKRWMLGSVAQKVARHSHVPVLIMSRACLREECLTLEKPGALCTLVGLDGSRWAESALYPAAQLVSLLSAPQQGELHLVRVIQSLSSDELALYRRACLVQNIEEEAASLAHEYLKNLVARLKDTLEAETSVRLSWAIVKGSDSAHTLLHLTETSQSDEATQLCHLVALATHGRGGFECWVMGSTAERVLAAATRPVLLVRPDLRKAS